MSHNFWRSHVVTQMILISTILILLTIPALFPTLVHAQGPECAENSADCVEVFEGDMPLLFAVGHGGWKQVGEQENGGYSADPLLRDYFLRILAVRIHEKTGHLPYYVYQQGNRNYVNTNRPVDHSEAYHPDNVEAGAAYFEFHNQVDTMIGRAEAEYGADMTAMINPHSADLPASLGPRPWDRIAEIGFIASVTNLGSGSNTMKALYDRKGEAALRGADSIPYQFFHGQDWPTPGAVWPAAAITNSKTLAKTGDDVWHVLPAYVTGWDTDGWVTSRYNGYSTIQYHGTDIYGHHSNWANGLDAFQIEVNYNRYAGISLNPSDPDYDQNGPYYQLDMPFTIALMDDLIDAILRSLQVNYNWTPGGVYNVIVDNGDPGFSTSGSWNVSSGKGFWGTTSIYTDTPGATATWTPTLAVSGTYEVLIRWTKTGSRTHDARYTVDYDGGSQTFPIDQTGGQDARWVSLGQFPFNAGTGGSVVLECTGTGSSTSADATLFRLISGAENQPPTASFTAVPTSGVAPLSVSFDASASTDPDGAIVSYDWNFGDEASGADNIASGITTAHTYINPGYYTVLLTVTDNMEATGTDSAVICAALPDSENGVIDNLDVEFTTTGVWEESSAVDEYRCSSLYATANGAAATWTPNLPEPGEYMVFAWWSYWDNRAQNAPYAINHANGSDIIRVNQGENTGQWVFLGAYPFDAGAGGNVTFTREAGDGETTSADAVKFVKINASIYLPIVLK